MTIKTLVAAILSAAILTGCATDMQNSPGETMGGLLGAVGGAVLGSQVGGGKGRLAAVAVGTLAGAWLGSSIGRNMDETDRLKSQRTTQDSLEYNKAGTTSSWSNPDSGYKGSTTPTRTYQTADQQACREYRSTVTIDGKTEEAVGTACREPDGTWRIVN